MPLRLSTPLPVNEKVALVWLASMVVVVTPAPLTDRLLVTLRPPRLSLYCPAGTLTTSAPVRTLACSIAARSVQVPSEALHRLSPVVWSCLSAVESTVNVAAADGLAASSKAASATRGVRMERLYA